MAAKTMRSIKLLLVAFLVLLLVACSSVTSGKVIDKHHEDAYYYTQMICSSYNSKGLCSVYVPITHHVDEKWVFTLENEEGDTGDLSVPKSDYDSVPLGTIYTKPGEE